MAWLPFKKKAPHLRACPRCGVEDAKNGVFCFHCGAQILQTAIIRPRKASSFTLPLWLSRLLWGLGFLALLVGGLWFFGDRLPFDPTFMTDLSILDGRGMRPGGRMVPRIATGHGAFKVVGTLLLGARKGRVTVKVFDASKTRPRWTRRVPTRFLLQRLVLPFPAEGDPPLVAGKYRVQISHGSRILAGLDFVAE